jgi:hypothetical protein
MFGYRSSPAEWPREVDDHRVKDLADWSERELARGCRGEQEQWNADGTDQGELAPGYVDVAGLTPFPPQQRGCGLSGSKQYQTTNEAVRYATAFNRRENADIGARTPLIGLFPLRIWHRLHRRTTAK